MSTPSLPRRRRLSAEERRRIIEEQAAKLFAERGYRGTGVEDVARAAGVTVPVLYDHFASKEELYRRLLEHHFAELRKIWARHVSSGPPTSGRALSAALDDWFGYIEQHAFAARLLFRETAGDAAIEAMHAEVAAASRAALLPLVEVELGASPEPHEAELTWEAMRGVIQTLALWWQGHPEVPRERMVSASMDAIWIGMERTRKGRRWKAVRR